MRRRQLYERRCWVWLGIYASAIYDFLSYRYHLFNALLPLSLSLSSLFLFLARVFGNVPDVSITQVVRKMSRRTKGKSSGSWSEISVEKRADGWQSVVEVEDSCSFPTVLHDLKDFSKNPKNRAEEVQNFPVSFSSSELSSHQMAVRRSFRQTSKLSPHQISV